MKDEAIWEMTLAEYANPADWLRAPMQKMPPWASPEAWDVFNSMRILRGGALAAARRELLYLLAIDQRARQLEHKYAVKDALIAGKDVPPQVLKDYPELTKGIVSEMKKDREAQEAFMSRLLSAETYANYRVLDAASATFTLKAPNGVTLEFELVPSCSGTNPVSLSVTARSPNKPKAVVSIVRGGDVTEDVMLLFQKMVRRFCVEQAEESESICREVAEMIMRS